jgi:hypothetical protein
MISAGEFLERVGIRPRVRHIINPTLIFVMLSILVRLYSARQLNDCPETPELFTRIVM